MRNRLVAGGLVVLLLSGCGVPTPFGGHPNPATATATPPVPQISTSNDPRVIALVKEGVKPLAGQDISGYMDKIEQALRSQLPQDTTAVTRSGDQIVVSLPTDPMFATGSSTIKPALKTALASIGSILKQNNKTVVDVYCYTDPSTNNPAARELSQRRAVATSTILVGEGVGQERFYIQGMGGSAPVTTDTSAVGQAQNRRIEIQISPVT